MHNILTDPIIRFDRPGGERAEASLPEVYAALMADAVDAFPALRPHQRHAWHAFLVQLGAMAMHQANVVEPPADPGEWARIIRSLTPEFPGDEPWQLVVGDITKPAFMQPPARSKERGKDYKSAVATPDELDIISTSKNHDLKSGVLHDAAVNDWLFALINLQTMAGQIGNGHYPISRMQSGWNSRTSFTLTSSLRLGGHVARDIAALLQVDFAAWPMRWDGIGLLWTERWDGNDAEALTLEKLHPYYLEVCRRRRLVTDYRGIYARVATGKQRLATKSSLGVVGDPWQLVDKRDNKGNKALAMQKDSFTYRRIVDYLFEGGDWDLPALFSAKQGDRYLVARGVKGNRGGQTEGYYERIIPLRQRLAQVFGRAAGTQEIADLARDRVREIGIVQRILSHAIQVFAARGDSANVSPEGRALARTWLNRLDEIVDAYFFEYLQMEFEAQGADRQGIRNQWLMNGHHGVVDHARNLLHDAADSLPCPAIHRYKARVNAEGLFEGRLRGNNGLPFLFDQADGEVGE